MGNETKTETGELNTIGYQVRRSYEVTRPEVYPLVQVDFRADLAKHIVERWALVAAIPDGEDSAGRQKLRLPDPLELAKRACDIAEETWTEFESRGWVLRIPAPVYDKPKTTAL